jgi:hypothetical protein
MTGWSAQMYTAFVGVDHSWPGWNALRSFPARVAILWAERLCDAHQYSLAIQLLDDIHGAARITGVMRGELENRLRSIHYNIAQGYFGDGRKPSPACPYVFTIATWQVREADEEHMPVDFANVRGDAVHMLVLERTANGQPLLEIVNNEQKRTKRHLCSIGE